MKKIFALVLFLMIVGTIVIVTSEDDDSVATTDEDMNFSSQMLEQNNSGSDAPSSAESAPFEPSRNEAFVPSGPDTSRNSQAPVDEEGIDAESLEPIADSQRLEEDLSADPNIQRIAVLESVSCGDDFCTFTLESRDEGEAGLQSAAIDFLRRHPDYGSHFRISVSQENPRRATFVVSSQPIGTF